MLPKRGVVIIYVIIIFTCTNLVIIFAGQKEFEMPSSCVPNCTSHCSKAKDVKLYCFPTNLEQQHVWIRAVRREKWMPNKHSRIFQFHFVSRKPSCFNYDKDYIPTIFSFSKARSNESDMSSKFARYNRLQKQRKQT